MNRIVLVANRRPIENNFSKIIKMTCERTRMMPYFRQNYCWIMWTMKIWMILVILSPLLFDSTFAQGKPSARRWSVRKTGEFGRRIAADHVASASSSSPSVSSRLLSQDIELPTRQFRLSAAAAARRGYGNVLDTSETRQYRRAAASAPVENSEFFRGAGGNPSSLEIRKPSLDLELPRFGGQNFVADQEAQETEDNEGYSYPKPEEDNEYDNSNGYDYSPPGVRPNEPNDDSTTTPPEPPQNIEPDVIPGDQIYAQALSPNKNESDEQIDSTGLHAKNKPPPSSPQVQGIPSSEEHDKSACSGSDDDPNCWPHGYEGVIPGKAGEDYPILSEIIQTDFSCDEQTFSGYYADADAQARCQIYHVCLKRNRYRKTQQWSFLCPNGTIFSQPDFVCVWWGDAPECSDTMVRSLYNLNEQLGWDNRTEGESGGSSRHHGGGSGELESAMSAFTAKAAAAAAARPAKLPYRVPVKVPEGPSGRARTKLQEVTQNALHGQTHDLDYGEHDGEESSNFETSLRQQSESRSKTKSGSALHKSISEGYELKGSPDAVQPFVVNRPPPPSAPTEQPQYESNDVVMMPTMQRFPDGSEGYAEVPVMLPHHGGGPTTQSPTHAKIQQGYEDDNEAEGYRYPNPTATPPPTYLPPRRTTPPPQTTEYFPPPTVPTEPPIPPADHENYEQSPDRVATTEQPEEGYRYPHPTTTETPLEQPDEGYSYPNPNQSAEQQQAAESDSEEGYRYPQPTTTERQPAPPQVDEDEQGYRYPNPTTTQRSSRFRQTIPTTTEQVTEGTTTEEPQEDGYNYQAPAAGSQFESLRETTTEQQQTGYNYPAPTTGSQFENVRETTTEQQQGYNYQKPAGSQFENVRETTTEQQQGYNYQKPAGSQFENVRETTTEQQQGYNYQKPAAGSQFESIRETTTEQQNGYNYPRPTTTENYELISTQQSANLVRDEDPVTTTTSPVIPTTTEVELPPGGYLPPPRSSNNELAKQQQLDGDSAAEELDYEEDEEANEVVTDSTSAAGISRDEDESGYSYNLPTPPASGNDIVLTGGALDSDEKLNEILKQIQSGGIEAVDGNGKPIEFSKLKQLLLNSPRGSVELKGELDSVTSSSTEVSTTPLAEIGGVQQQQQQTDAPPQQSSSAPQQPFYHTVTNAVILPNNPNSNNLFNTNSQSPVVTNTGNLPSPSGFYLPPNINSNNAVNNQPALQQPQQQQYYNNEVVQYVDHPSYEIKVPSREFETHSVDVNSIAVDTNNQQNRPFNQRQPLSGYYDQQPQQQQSNIPQQQFFQQQSPPPGNYLPPPQRQVQVQVQHQPQPDYERSNTLNNLILPAPQPQRQQQPLSQSSPSGEYLPPRQATSSILQPQYYPQPPSSPARPFVSQPIQLTENIQLQQSFALPTQQPLLPTNGRNPLVDPKDIKIVPALFVHQHTSVDSQDVRGQTSGSSGNINDAFQTLDTAQSNYYTAASSSLSQQLHQLASLTPPQSTSYSTGQQRQFFRRSNGNNNNGGSGAASSPIIEKAQQVSTFTLEDARTPEELQKYHHEDLKKFHNRNIANHPEGVLDDTAVIVPQRPPTTRATIPVISSIAREPQRSSSSSSRGGRRENGGSSSSSTGSNRFSVSSSTHSDRTNSNQNFPPSSHRNEEYFIPVSGSYGGSGSSSSTPSSSGGGGSIVRNSNSNSNSNDSNNYSQFRVNGGSRSSNRGGGGGGGGNSGRSSYQFLDSERTLLNRFLPEREGGFGARLLL